MKHLIIIPAYNEEENIDRVIASLVMQTEVPTKLVIVDDGSTDGTADIVKGWAEKHAWINIVQNKNKERRAHGSKIVRAFNLGLNTVNIQEFDAISKFDADIEFPENYLESISGLLGKEDRIGLIGGGQLTPTKSGWKRDMLTKTDHVNGPVKTYRKRAFVEIGGLIPSMGWDTADEFKLRFAGWKVQRHPDVFVKHYRLTFTEIGWQQAAKKNAMVYHKLRYGLFLGITSSLKRGLKFRPFIISGVATLVYFLLQYFGDVKPIVNKEEGKFIRDFRLKTMFK